MIKSFFRAGLTTFLTALSFAVFASAQTEPNNNFPNIKIKNFGQMDERYYRGAQPEKDDYPALKALGVNTVIDLRDDPTDYEKSAVEALGMKYVNIPLSGWKYPKPERIKEFLELVNDPATGTFFAHCHAGKHRAGVAGAVYRFTKYGWGYEQVYKEMKKYNFSTWMVHGRLKTFVKDYAEKMEAEKAASPVFQDAVLANQ